MTAHEKHHNVELEDIIDRTTSTYNKIAHTYSKCWLGDPVMKQSLDIFISALPPNSYVADIGCGVGRDVKYLLDHGINAIGVDISREMLKEAKIVIPNGIFYVMDMRALAISSNSLDGVWACASVLHMPKQFIDQIIDEFYRILRIDGILFLSMQESDVDELHEPEGRYFAYYKRDELISILCHHKFNIIEMTANVSNKNTFNKPVSSKWNNFFARKV